jgi:uncharacterized glyoxalase superfamily protein PhnB
MRFLQITTGQNMTGPRDPEHMAQVRKAIGENIASGSLVATGPIGKRATAAARVTRKDGKVTVEDPPSGDGWMAGGGFALFEADSKEAAIADVTRKLEIMGDGVMEVIQVGEMYPPAVGEGQPILGVVPYVNVPNATEAIEFYKKAFAAREVARMLAEDGKRIMHCHLIINGGAFMVADVFEEYGNKHEPSGSFTMTLVIRDGDLWWNRAISAGCKETLPFNTAPWGDRYGQQVDPYGVRWAFNQPGQRG